MKLTYFPIFYKKRVFVLSKGSFQKACYFLKILKEKTCFSIRPPPHETPPKLWGGPFNFPYGGGKPKIISPPGSQNMGGGKKISPPGSRNVGGKSPNVFGRLRRPIKISIFCRLFVPIFTAVSTAPGDILDTIECFSVVRNTLLSLATPNREVLMFFTQFHLVNDSKIYLFTPAVGKNYSVFSFMLVYRTHLGKHKTLWPAAGAKNCTLGHC